MCRGKHVFWYPGSALGSVASHPFDLSVKSKPVTAEAPSLVISYEKMLVGGLCGVGINKSSVGQ